ncbi:MAG: PHP domain-containing protein [bacterium]|nr:PHP domain-containing protein [bacterium]
MIGTFHIHTSYSFDANIPPARIVGHIQKLGLDFAAITDHGTIKGALEANKIGKVNIIVGAEYYTDEGDIIGLFLKNEVISKSSKKVIQEIKNQGGLVVLPHPYREHKLDNELIEAVDIIEVYNSRCTNGENRMAMALAKEYNKPVIVGSDAHFLREIGLTKMSFNDYNIKSALLNGNGNILTTERSPLYNRIFTGLINLYKRWV